MPLDDLVLMPEPLARRALAGTRVRMRLLAPLGPFAGRGTLRVLRSTPEDDAVELVCGYEAYEPL